MIKNKEYYCFIILLIIFSSGISSHSMAQKERFLSIELAGSGGFGSINYERKLVEKQVFKLYGRLGMSVAPVDRNNGFALVFPIMVHGLFGENGHYADLALGQTLSITTKGSIFVRMPLGLGYRFQPIDKRYYLRMSYTPIVSYLVDYQFEHWAGFTYGYQLKSTK